MSPLWSNPRRPTAACALSAHADIDKRKARAATAAHVDPEMLWREPAIFTGLLLLAKCEDV